MLSYKQKLTIINNMLPLKIWVDNYGSIRLEELIEDCLEWLDYAITESEAIKFLKGICSIGFDNSITKINI